MAINAEALTFENHNINERIVRLHLPLLKKAHKAVTLYVYFHLAYLLLAAVEVGVFFSFFALLGKSSVLAFLLSLSLLTLFSFFVLRLYLQAKKPEQLLSICEEYITECKTFIGYQDGIPEHHIALASALQKLSQELHEREYFFYSPPEYLKSLMQTMEKFSAFCHWKDLHLMKEYLLNSAIEEHIKAVKCEPTNLEVHAALANAYVMLSSLYADPRKYEGFDDDRYIPVERFSKEMQETFREVAEKAIEEFKILNDYAPDDPWVHIQLAYSYHDLQMPEEEIREYETILSLRQDDKETLFKLGMLYFQQGMNAKGLRIYDTLKKTNYQKAENLIKFYGSY